MSEIFRHTKKCCLKFFRKLSISNGKSTNGMGNSECNAKYKPQKNHSITLSPLSSKMKNRKKSRKKEIKQEDYDDDLSINSNSKHRKSYIKTCIKKKLNKNYEKQVNCINDENIVFTDNKIYISLNHRRASVNSSFGASSTSSRLKDRRVIYPSSGNTKLTGFLKDYDFNYDYKSDDEQKSEPGERLKFNMMCDSTFSTPLAMSPLNNVVFEKVKYDKNKRYMSREDEEEEERRQLQCMSMSSTERDTRNSFYLDPFVDFSDNNDSLLTNTTFIAEWNNFQECRPDDDEEDDDVQWRNFIEYRKQGHSNPFLSTANMHSKNAACNENFYNTTSFSDDSGIGRSTTDINRNLKTLETWLDDENFDNSFNEELERRVQIEVPQYYEHSNSSNVYYNNINNNNHCTDKYS